MNVQHAAEAAIENQLRQFGRDYHATQAATVVADLDGGVRAMVGGRDYGASQFNRAVDAYRQPGSSFKPYVYTTALLNGFRPSSIVVDGPVCIGNWCPQNYGHSYAGAVTLTQAITHSINVIPVKLSIALGKGNPKIGRAKIVEIARRFGIKAPLPDTPSLPIGADEVTVLEHAVAYVTFPNRGKAVTPHAVLEVRTGAGDLVWRYDRDGPKPTQAIPASIAADMAGMMSHVVSEGTARRAGLDGIPTAGKTGTTNAYRDAWFVGYTGNFVCAVWYGNDDYSPTNRMTGGSLPAQTWHDIMVAAHEGVEIKELAGVGMGTKLPTPASAATVAANGGPKVLDVKPGPPPVLTKRGADILVRVEKLLDEAGKSAGKTSSNEPPNPARPATSSSLALPESPSRRHRMARSHPSNARTDVRLIFITLLALVIAAFIGLGATWVTATRGTDLATLTIGAWTARPKNGTADVDPYSRATIARSGELPLGAGDGVAFLATTDDRKRPLDGRCDVVVSGVTPAGAVLDTDAVRPEGTSGGELAKALRLHQRRDHPRRRRRLRDPRGVAVALRQLAAYRRHRALCADASALRYAGRGGDTDPARCPDALDRDGGVPVIRVLFTIIAGVLLGGVVHLVSVLALPRIATQDAYSRLDADHEAQRRHHAATGGPGQQPDALHGSGVRDRGLPLRPVGRADQARGAGQPGLHCRCRSIRAATPPITASMTGRPDAR